MKIAINSLIILIGMMSPIVWAEPAWDSQPKEKPSLPAGKLIRPLQSKESWIVASSSRAEPNKSRASDVRTSPSERNPAAPVQGKQETVRMDLIDQILLIETKSSNPADSLRSYEYSTMGLYYEESPQLGEPVLMSIPQPETGGGTPSLHYLVYWACKAKEFPDFDWINPSNYIGVESVDGTPCWVFASPSRKAWVDIAKREPKLWMGKSKADGASGEILEVRKFSNQGTPSSIALPAKVKSHMEGYAEQVRNLLAPPRRGPRPQY